MSRIRKNSEHPFSEQWLLGQAQLSDLDWVKEGRHSYIKEEVFIQEAANLNDINWLREPVKEDMESHGGAIIPDDSYVGATGDPDNDYYPNASDDDDDAYLCNKSTFREHYNDLEWLKRIFRTFADGCMQEDAVQRFLMAERLLRWRRQNRERLERQQHRQELEHQLRSDRTGIGTLK